MHEDNLHCETFHAECWEFRLLCENYNINNIDAVIMDGPFEFSDLHICKRN